MNERITIGSHDADHQFCPDLVVEYREECDRILAGLSATIRSISYSGVRGKEFRQSCEAASARAIQELKNALSEATRLRAFCDPAGVPRERGL